MDKCIEILAFLLKDENLFSSVVMLLAVVFISGLVVFILSRISRDRIEGELIKERKFSESVIQTRDELFSTQKNDQKHIEDLQQKLIEATESLMESEKLQSDFRLKNGQLTKELDTKQTELDKQKNHLSEQSVNGQKIEEIEQEAIQLAKDLVLVKQKLKKQEDEINKKDKQIDTFKATGQIVVEEGGDKISALENTIENNQQQLSRFNEKLQLILSQVQPEIQSDPLSTDEVKGSDGILGKLLSFVSNRDNVEIKELSRNSKDDAINLDVWQEHQIIIDQLTDQLILATESVEEQIEMTENENSAESDRLDLSEQVAEVVDETTEKVDLFQKKLVGFYQKIVS